MVEKGYILKRLKISLPIYAVFLVVIISLKTYTIKISQDIQVLGEKIKKVEDDLAKSREKIKEYQFFKVFINQYELSQKISDEILNFLIILSNSVSKNVSVREVYISYDGIGNFNIKGKVDNIKSFRVFCEKLDRKRGEYIVKVEPQRIEPEINEFEVKGYFTKKEREKRKGDKKTQ